ncbi:hypothetical protein D3C78_1508790 [compost metagenome]
MRPTGSSHLPHPDVAHLTVMGIAITAPGYAAVVFDLGFEGCQKAPDHLVGGRIAREHAAGR